MSTHSASAKTNAASIRADEKTERADLRIIQAPCQSDNKTSQTVKRALQTIGACLADDDIADVPRPAKILKMKDNGVIEADISLMTGGSDKGVVNAGTGPCRN